MADEIMEELWRIKDELSNEAGDDMNAYCRQLNEKALAQGFILVSRSDSSELMVAEEPEGYKT
jgi:hypothetical protein